MARPELKYAIAGTKSKASDYNDNFDTLMDYFEDTLDESLATYKEINTLSSAGTIALTDNSINKLSASGAVTFSLPEVTNTTSHQILVQLYMANVVSIDMGTYYFFNGASPNMELAGHYNIVFEYDCNDNHWYCGAVYKGAS